MTQTKTMGSLVVHITDGGAVYVADRHGFADAKFVVRIDSDHNSYKDSLAAGHLFAAAPALLAALRSFLRAPSIGSNGPGSVTIEVTTFNLDAARAAVAAAEAKAHA